MEEQELKRYPPGVVARRQLSLTDDEGENDSLEDEDEEGEGAIPGEIKEPPASAQISEEAQSARQRALADRAEKAKQRKERREKVPPPEQAYVPGESAVPAGESRPMQRDRPTLELEVPEAEEPESDVPHDFTDPKKKTFRSLADIMAEYAVGDNNIRVSVDRLAPKTFGNQNIKGQLGSIRRQMTDEEFRRVFGGGEYLLRVYGPSPAGRRDKSGKIKIHALTQPINYHVPGDPEIDIPPEALELSMDGGKEPMTTYAQRTLTPADATVAQALIKNNEASTGRALDVQEKRIAEKEAAAAAAVQSVEKSAQVALASMNAQLAEARQDRLRLEALVEEQRREHERARAELLKTKGPEVEVIAGMQSVYANASNGLQNEMARQATAHREQIERLDREHRTMRETADERYHRAVRESAEREERLREQHAETIRSQREQHEQRLSDLRSQHESTLSQLRADYEGRLALERDRAVSGKDSEKQVFEMRLQTEKAGWTTTRSLLDTRIEQLERDAADLRKKLADKEDFAQQLDKYKQIGELLGMQPKEDGDSGPRTWQERLAASFESFMAGAPEIVGNLSAAMQARNMGMQLQQAHLQQQAQQQQPQVAYTQQMPPGALPPGAPQQQQAPPQGRRIPTRQNPRGAQTFGGSGDPDAAPTAGDYRGGVVAQAPDTSRASAQSHARPSQAAPPAQPQVQAPIDAVHVAQSLETQQPPQPEQADDGEGDGEEGEPRELTAEEQKFYGLLDQVLKRLELAFVNESPVNESVAQVYQQAPPPAVYMVAQQFPPELVISRLEETNPDSELLTMEGKKYVKAASNAFIIQGRAILGI